MRMDCTSRTAIHLLPSMTSAYVIQIKKQKKSAISNNSKTMKDTVSLSADFLSKIVDITEK